MNSKTECYVCNSFIVLGSQSSSAPIGTEETDLVLN